MAKTIRSRESIDLDLPLFSIESSVFLDLIQRVFGESCDIVATVDHREDGTQTILEGIADIKSHISMFRGDIEIKIGELRISVGRFSNCVQFREPQRALAISLISELREYVPIWIPFIALSKRKGLLFTAWLLVILSILSYKHFPATIAPFRLHILLFFCATWLTLTAANLRSIWARPHIIYRPRDTFISRNKDKIVLGIVSSLCTLAIAQYGPQVLQYLTSTTVTNGQVQQKTPTSSAQQSPRP